MHFHPVSYYLVCGASSGIGLALVAELLQERPNTHLFATHRSRSNLAQLNELLRSYPDRMTLIGLEASQENDFAQAATMISGKTNQLSGIINTIGSLHTQNIHPERKIEEFDVDAHLELYRVNTLPTLLIGKYFKDLIKTSPSPFFATLSAKVGSIGDNQMGGWYSYRISKAALNMAIKNLAIEFERINKKAKVVAIHPGTTETKLSEPFLSGARKRYQIHTPRQSAQNILKVIDQVFEHESGQFFSWDGTKLPW